MNDESRTATPDHAAPTPTETTTHGSRTAEGTSADASVGTSTSETAALPAELVRLRGSIDNIDAALVYLLAERFKATQQVGVLKASRGLPPSDPGREARQVARLRTLAQEAELDPVFAEKFLAFIVDEVIRHHEAIASDARTAG